MKVREILEFLDSQYPLNCAEEYDNVGLLIGNPDAEVENAVISLDCTYNTVKLAKSKNANLIITHHPVIFDPVHKLICGSIPYVLIKNDISVISLHTNLDKASGGVNDCLAEKIGLTDIKEYKTADGFSIRYGKLKSSMPAEAFAEEVAQKINPHIRFTGENEIKTVAVCSGSGGSFADEVFAFSDAFVTADVKHNVFISASVLGKTVIDAGHFETEDIIVPELAEKLSGKFKDIRFFQDRLSVIKYI